MNLLILVDLEIENQNILSMYLLSCLTENTYFEVVEEDGEALGILIGKLEYEYNNIRKCRNISSINNSSMILSRLNKIKNREIIGCSKMMKDYNRSNNNYFNGEIVLFIVRKKLRGRGIGKSLMNNFINHCRNKNIKSILVCTDSESDYGFYDNYGFIKVNREKLDFTAI